LSGNEGSNNGREHDSKHVEALEMEHFLDAVPGRRFRFDQDKTEQDANLKLVELAVSPRVKVHPDSILGRIDKDNPAVRQDVFFLLQSACTGFRLSSMQANLSPHELEQRLTDLASKAKNLAIDADEFSYFLPDAINSAYLTERAGSDMPADFSRRRRSGLRKGTYALLHPETPSLTDLLLAFSDDILEEVSNLKRHGFKSDGGDDAAIRYQIRKLKYLMGQLFRKSNNPLIAAILSAINQQHISEDRVKKAVYKKGRNT